MISARTLLRCDLSVMREQSVAISAGGNLFRRCRLNSSHETQPSANRSINRKSWRSLIRILLFSSKSLNKREVTLRLD
jgi:hypothetical protein